MQIPFRLEISNVSVRYGPSLALSEVNLTIKSGRITALLGPNGSGKTTLLSVISGLSQPQSGTIDIGGINPVKESTKIKEISGYVADIPMLYESLTPMEMFEFVGSVREIGRKKLEERIFTLSNLLGIEGDLDNLIGNLSFGSKQKVAIVSALLHDPRLLIMDESMNGLDPYSAMAMKGILREMAASGAMIVFSTHMLEVADSFCDEVVILDSGKVVESGNVDDLKRYKREGSTMKDLFYRAITPNAAHGITPEMEGR